MNNIYSFKKQFEFLSIIMLLFFMTYTADVFAAEDETGIVTIFCNVINEITGGVGKVISVLILISMAIGLFLGKITWGLAIAVMVGMGLLFGAKGLVDVIASGSSSEADSNKAKDLCGSSN